VYKSARHPIGDIEQRNWLDHFVVSVGHRCLLQQPHFSR